MEATQETTSSAPTMPTAIPSTGGRPYVDVMPAELSRFLRIAMAKGGGGEPPFPLVDISYVVEPDGTRRLSSSHQNKAGLLMMRLETVLPHRDDNGPVGFECAVQKGAWLLDYLSTYAVDKPVRLSYDPDAGVVYLTDGRRVTKTPAVGIGEITRPQGKDGAAPFQRATGAGHYISTNPANAPSPDASFDAWAAKGYSVVFVPLGYLDQLMASGSTLVSHGYRGTVMEVGVEGWTFSVTFRDPKAQERADTVTDTNPPGSVVTGLPTDSYRLPYGNIEPFLATARLLRTEGVWFVHYPTESRMNIVGVEVDAQKAVTLRLTQSLALERKSK